MLSGSVFRETDQRDLFDASGWLLRAEGGIPQLVRTARDIRGLRIHGRRSALGGFVVLAGRLCQGIGRGSSTGLVGISRGRPQTGSRDSCSRLRGLTRSVAHGDRRFDPRGGRRSTCCAVAGRTWEIRLCGERFFGNLGLCVEVSQPGAGHLVVDISGEHQPVNLAGSVRLASALKIGGQP